MTHPNNRYNPNWETVHDHHAAERNRVSKQLQGLDWQEGAGTAERALLKAEYEHHQEAFYQALLSQHRTVQDYAEWLLRHSPLGHGLERAGQVCVPPDFSGMTTIEDVNAEHRRLKRQLDTAAAEIRGRLETGQPPGLLAFADARSPRLMRYWRGFSGDELCSCGYCGSSGARALVTIDEQADGWHVCFMQEPEVRGVSVTNCIETLATCLYREARVLTGVDGIRYPNPLARLRHRWATRHLRAAFAPTQFHFYQHTCAVPGLPENFDRVLLRFEEGHFHDPEWVGFKVMPEAIQQARHECAHDTGRTAQALRLT